MHGISKSKHKHLIDALLQLKNLSPATENELNETEGVLHDKVEREGERASDLTATLTEELEELYLTYNITLQSLGIIIKNYDELYKFIKTEYVGKRLKALKKNMPADKEHIDSKSLRDNIHTVYGT
ncbi:hypothetical protein [Pedobacter psychroterrae]|uniref:Uncharacterized protein n=1 Tax=Pedobacter psychroterrae TaxID=2530453 RepID=A0A4R0NCN8_9SPHI|nr:hypothetical protein [Pedobacter psychroterrae]TCC96822.1 hypothetical protein EZ437_20770 [Pedobacter psychroterrae]